MFNDLAELVITVVDHVSDRIRDDVELSLQVLNIFFQVAIYDPLGDHLVVNVGVSKESTFSLKPNLRLILVQDVSLIVVFVLIKLNLSIDRFLVDLDDLELSLFVDWLENLLFVQIETFCLHFGFDLRVLRENLFMQESFC